MLAEMTFLQCVWNVTLGCIGFLLAIIWIIALWGGGAIAMTAFDREHWITAFLQFLGGAILVILTISLLAWAIQGNQGDNYFYPERSTYLKRLEKP